MSGNSFYPNARFDIEIGAPSSVNPYQAAMRLIGICTVEEFDASAASEAREQLSREFYAALHEVEVAIALGALKAANARTTWNRHFERMAADVESKHGGGSKLVIPPGNYTYISLVDLCKWWQSHNDAMGSDSDVPTLPPIQRRTSQEHAILAKLQELGYDPLRLKRAESGKRSEPKTEARDALPYSRAVFDKAWQRLRCDKRIRDT